MRDFRTICFLLLIAVVLTACQADDPDAGLDSAAPAAAGSGIQSLQEALIAAGANLTQNDSFEAIFSVPGQVLLVNGEVVQVYQYPDPAQAEAEASQVSPDGFSIGETHASWTGPPHFFQSGNLIAIYVGRNQTTLDHIESVLGPQIAGASLPPRAGSGAQPPLAMLQIGDKNQPSGIGSYCWPDSDTGAALCSDKLGLPTAQDPLQVTAPFIAGLSIPPPDTPDVLTLSTIPLTPEDQMQDETDGLRWWPPNPSSSQLELPLEPPHELELSLAPGLYALSIFAQWQDFGDVNYGFLVEVLPPEGSGAPSGEAAAVVILSISGLNVRSAPDLTSEVIRVLAQNEEVEVLGKSPEGAWWQVPCPVGTEGSCWISADPLLSAPVENN